MCSKLLKSALSLLPWETLALELEPDKPSVIILDRALGVNDIKTSGKWWSTLSNELSQQKSCTAYAVYALLQCLDVLTSCNNTISAPLP